MTHIPNHIDYIEFPAPDAAAHGASKAFYEQVFGWKYQDWGSDYSDTQGSGLGSGISSQPGTRPLPLAVIYTDRLEGTMAKVEASGGEITQPIFSFPGGRRFHFRDPAGNELAVWSDQQAGAGGGCLLCG